MHRNLESSQGLNGTCDHWGPPRISCQGRSSTHPASPKQISKMPKEKLPKNPQLASSSLLQECAVGLGCSGSPHSTGMQGSRKGRGGRKKPEMAPNKACQSAAHRDTRRARRKSGSTFKESCNHVSALRSDCDLPVIIADSSQLKAGCVWKIRKRRKEERREGGAREEKDREEVGVHA